jgi:FkbM family methyltransferase
MTLKDIHILANKLLKGMIVKMIKSINWHIKRIIKKVIYSLKIAFYPVVTINGIKLIIQKEWSFNVKDHLIRKDYETGEVEIIKKNIVSDDIVLEIGTGLGFLSIFCSKIVGQENVISVEANPFLKEYHEKVFKQNHQYPKILYNSIGKSGEETVFFIDRKNFWSSSLIPLEGSNIIGLNVKNIDINDLIETTLPTFLIIDVEGFESELIKQIKDFKSIIKIQIETHPQLIGMDKVNEIITVLESHSFIFSTDYSKENQFFFKK